MSDSESIILIIYANANLYFLDFAFIALQRFYYNKQKTQVTPMFQDFLRNIVNHQHIPALTLSAQRLKMLTVFTRVTVQLNFVTRSRIPLKIEMTRSTPIHKDLSIRNRPPLNHLTLH
jgi:hypothetical protein